MDKRFLIDFGNGYTVVQQPRNANAIKIELIWKSLVPSATVQSINFEWLGDTAKKIYEYRDSGLITSNVLNHTQGGLGIYEGLPLRIELCTNPIKSFDFVLDLANEATLWECDRVVCPIKESGRIDWLNDIASSFTFSYLASADYLLNTPAPHLGKITQADYKWTPYCISEIPDYTTAASLLVNLFLIGYETVQKVEDLFEDIYKMWRDMATATDILALGGIFVDLIQVTYDLAQVVFLMDMFIKTLNDIIAQIIQTKKYKFCMREEDLFLKACAYLGLTFSSTIYAPTSQFFNATWMPAKIVQPQEYSGLTLNLFTFDRPEDERENPNKAYGYFDGTFKEFIEIMKMKYNAEVVVNNGVLYFEEKHYWVTQNAWTIPNTDDVGYSFNYPDPHGTNAALLPFTYMVQFSVDESELNTLHKYKGTTCQYVVTPSVVHNKKNLLKNSGVIIDLPCALGKRKDYFTKPEDLLKQNHNGMVGLMTAVTAAETLVVIAMSLTAGIVGYGLGQVAAANFVVPDFDIDDRLGWLLLSNDSFSVPKTFIGERANGDWEVSPDSENIMSAVNLMNFFHRKNLGTHGAQRLTYKDKKFKFCCDDFEQVLNSNVFQTMDNRFGEFERILWDVGTDTATADYGIKQNFTNNLTEQIIIDGHG